MGIEYSKYVWENYKKQGGHKLVMLALADFANDSTGECWPSIATLAEMVCVSDRQIQKVINDLKQSGDIEVKEVHGRKHTNTYKIIKKGELHDTFTEELKVNSSVENMKLELEKVNYSTGKVNYSTGKGELQFTRSTIEPIDPPIKTSATRQSKKSIDAKSSKSNEQSALVKKILDAYIELRGQNGVNYAKEGAWAKRIASECPDIEMVKGCYQWLKQDKFYEFKPLSLAKIYESLPEFKRYIDKKGVPKVATETPEWVLQDLTMYEGGKFWKNTKTGEKKPYVNP